DILFVLRLRERKLCLKHFQTRSAAGVEALLGGIPCAHSEFLQLREHLKTRLRDDPAEIGLADLGADFDDRLVDLSFPRVERGLADGNSPAALPPDLERKSQAVRLLRCPLFELDARFRIQTLSRDAHSDKVDRSAQTLGDDRRIRREKACERGV